MVGGALPELRQPKAGRGLRRAGADALAKRIRRARARRVESRQSAAADNDDPTCLAVVATSAEFGAGAMVQGTRQTQWRTPAQDDDRRAGAQTAGRALEICDRRHRRRRRRDEGCLSLVDFAPTQPHLLDALTGQLPGASQGAGVGKVVVLTSGEGALSTPPTIAVTRYR